MNEQVFIGKKLEWMDNDERVVLVRNEHFMKMEFFKFWHVFKHNIWQFFKLKKLTFWKLNVEKSISNA